jgi:hypothetical protein
MGPASPPHSRLQLGEGVGHQSSQGRGGPPMAHCPVASGPQDRLSDWGINLGCHRLPGCSAQHPLPCSLSSSPLLLCALCKLWGSPLRLLTEGCVYGGDKPSPFQLRRGEGSLSSQSLPLGRENFGCTSSEPGGWGEPGTTDSAPHPKPHGGAGRGDSDAQDRAWGGGQGCANCWGPCAPPPKK